MSDLQIKYVTDKNDNRVLPVTHLDAVRDDNGNTLTSLMSPENLGNGIGTCSTSSGTALTVTLSGYNLVQNGFVAVTFANDVPAGATLNINGKGAKPVIYKGSAIGVGIIKAGDTAMLSYDGTNYVLCSSGDVSAEATRAQAAEEQLRTLYNNLQQSQPVPVTTLPATGEAGKIYRLAGTTSYADYMYAEGALTTPIKMAEYDNAIDDEPTAGSDNLVKSGGVFNSINRILYRVFDAYGKVQPLNYEILINDGSTRVLSGDDYDTSDFIEINNAAEVIEYKNLFPVASIYRGLCIYDSERNLLKASGGSGNIDLSDYPLAKYLRYSYSRNHDIVYVCVRSRDKESSVTENLINVGQTRSFTTIQDAVNSITDNSSSNRYTVLVDEGDYDISNAGITHIPIKPYVNIIGVSKKARIIQRIASYNSGYNAFENISGFSGEAEIANFTIITEKSKGALHLDSNNWSGKIHFHDIECQVIENEEPYDPSLDYYKRMAASHGAINTATWGNQEIVIENVVTNGYIYSHTENNGTNNLNVAPSKFVVRNCICDWIGLYSNGDKVRKTAIIERNRCNYIKISFDDKSNLGFMTWDDILLNDNRCSFVIGEYKPYGGADTNHNLWDEYYNKQIPCPDKSLHTAVQNITGSTINRGTKVKFTDYRHRYIQASADSNDFDAITVHTIENNAYGVVQDGGDLNIFWDYILAHPYERVV